MLRIWIVLVAVVILCPPLAAADMIRPRSNVGGEITGVARGVKELGLDGIVVLGYSSTGETSSFRATSIAGGAFRYFLRDNLAVGLALGGLYTQTTSDQKDLGGFGLLSLNYLARIGGGLFFKPGIGGGGFFGSRRTALDGGLTQSVGIRGGAVKLDLGFVFYASSRFNLYAGPQLVVLFGSTAPETGEGQSLLTADGAIDVGLSYVF